MVNASRASGAAVAGRASGRSPKQQRASLRNIQKAQLSRYRRREPRSPGRVRPLRRS